MLASALVRRGHALGRRVRLEQPPAEEHADEAADGVHGRRDQQHDRDGGAQDARRVEAEGVRAVEGRARHGPARAAEARHVHVPAPRAVEVQLLAAGLVERQGFVERLAHAPRRLEEAGHAPHPIVAAKAPEAVQARVLRGAVRLVRARAQLLDRARFDGLARGDRGAPRANVLAQPPRAAVARGAAPALVEARLGLAHARARHVARREAHGEERGQEQGHFARCSARWRRPRGRRLGKGVAERRAGHFADSSASALSRL